MLYANTGTCFRGMYWEYTPNTNLSMFLFCIGDQRRRASMRGIFIQKIKQKQGVHLAKRGAFK